MILSILCVSQGLGAVCAILGSVLIAAGKEKILAMVMSLYLLPAVLIFILCIYLQGSLGAAVASLVNALLIALIFGRLIWQQYGMFLQGRNLGKIMLAGVLMFLVHAVLPQFVGLFSPLPMAISMVVYMVILLLLGEIGQQDFAAIFKPKRDHLSPVQRGKPHG